MDPVTSGAVLAGVAGGAGGAFGSQVWGGLSALIRHPFRHDRPAGDNAPVSGGEPELAALEQAPADERRAVALAEVLVARADADGGFREALQAWWEQASQVQAGGDVANRGSGGTPDGPGLSGRGFARPTFGFPSRSPPAPP